MSRRMERVNELIREELSELILRQLRDPRVAGLISVTSVETSPDLGHATVFVSVLGEKTDRAAALAGLGQAAGFLRRTLRSRLKLRQVPDLLFRLDESIEQGFRIMELLQSVPPADDDGLSADDERRATNDEQRTKDDQQRVNEDRPGAVNTRAGLYSARSNSDLGPHDDGYPTLGTAR